MVNNKISQVLSQKQIQTLNIPKLEMMANMIILSQGKL